VDDITLSVEDSIATITLNRPHARNAFSLTMIREWEAMLTSCRRDDDVRVVVLTGAGDSAFCAGVDLSWLGDNRAPLQRKHDLHDGIQRVALAVDDLDKPLVAAINGVAVGAGLDMALMCDMRIMSTSARLSEGYVKLGLAPGDGGAYYLPRLIGISRALELLLTGEFVDAEEALRIGIVNRISAPEQLMSDTMTLARTLAANPPQSVRMIKRATRQSASIDLRTALDLASSHLAVLATTEDAAEALAAVKEKRPGRYRGQ
jgi:enoyl-CoA hydratase/carnithine racemase